MILIVDNYDSFVYNVARYCEELDQRTLTLRNDRVTLADIEALRPDALIISPGPCTPNEAGISLSAIRAFSGTIPILGICLGHQCIGSSFGGTVIQAKTPMHGRASSILHEGTGLFKGLPVPLVVGRYHSLIVAEQPSMKDALTIDARSGDAEIMALSHKTHPTWGVQFHPESVLTDHGHQMLANFFELAQQWRDR